MITGKRYTRPLPVPMSKVTDRVGPFKGMRSTLSGSADKGFAEWLHNCYVTDPINGSEIIARPGRQAYPPSGPVQLGTQDTTARFTQLLAEYAPFGGIRRGIAIQGSKFYATGLSAGGWTEAVNAAAFTAAGITLTTHTHFACMFAGKLVVVNPTYAFTWDGTTNGGITKLTNAGTSFWGKPTVYAAKLYFIHGNRKTIIWSEEGDPTIGYQTGGYANAWDLIQTSTDSLSSILGTNDAFYYFRTSGIGIIYGGSAADFKSSSTHDAVSHTVGSDCADGVCLGGDGTIWFLDNQGRPCYFRTGSSEIIPIWTEIERAFTPYIGDGRGYDFLAAPNTEQAAFLTYTDIGQAVYLRSLDLVCFTFRYFQSAAFAQTSFDGIADFAVDVVVGFHGTAKTCQTVWSFPTPTMKICEHFDSYRGTDAFGLLMADQYGYVYSLNPSYLGSFPARSLSWYTDKDFRFADRDVTASVIGPRHFEVQGTELRASRLDLEYIGGIANAPLSLRWATPNILQQKGVRFDTGQPLVLPMEGNASVPGQQVAPLNAEMSVGLNELGRWIAFGLSWGHQASQARLVGWTVTATPDSQYPKVA